MATNILALPPCCQRCLDYLCMVMDKWKGSRKNMGWSSASRNGTKLLMKELIAGHDWKIFPILHRRHLFADVEQFFLYDLYRADGGVDENVFAYSNIHNDERGLVLYHNRFADTSGWIKISAAYLDKGTGDLRQKSLAEALGLPFEGYVIFKDYVTHLEYIRSCEEFWQKGMYVELARLPASCLHGLAICRR